jgi:KDO2-lipid IV(A) lauroyltransferase
MISSHVRPRGPAYAVSLGRALGRFMWAVLGKRRALSLRNAEVALPHLTQRERQRVVREAFQNSCAYWPEPATYSFLGPRKILHTVHVEGREHLDAAIAQGKGVIAPEIHLGIFPLLGTWMFQAGYDFQFLGRVPHNRRALDVMVRCWARLGSSVILDFPRRQCLKDCRGLLTRGGILGLLLDQRAMATYPGVDVPFFGREFHAFGGMVSLALKTGSRIVPMYIIRDRGIHHRLVIEPEIKVDRNLPRKEAVRCAIEILMGRFEEWIVEHPEHFWWPHHFWQGV